MSGELYVALDAGYLNEEAFNVLIAQADEVARIIGGPGDSAKRRREV